MEYDEAPARRNTDTASPAILSLVQSALREVITAKNNGHPSNRQEWVDYLTEALVSETDTPYESVITAMMSNGISSEEVFQRYVPDAARHLGEMWLADKASFVDVTLGAARLQRLFRNRETYSRMDWRGRSIPHGHSVLMAIPRFEEHSLGAFVAADDLRRNGLWVHMGIAIDGPELVEILKTNRFSMLGVSLATQESLDKAAALLQFVKRNVDNLPPIVIGGCAAEIADAVTCTGADFIAQSAKKVIELCGLPTVAQTHGQDELFVANEHVR